VQLALPLPALLAAAAAIGVVDLVENTWSLPTAALAVVDWTAHLATMLLVLAALRPVPTRLFALAAFAGTVLLDLDHLPQHFGERLITKGTIRPYTHSLITVLALFAIGRWLAAPASASREVVYGLAGGVAAHVWRDLATGVPFWWPFSRNDLVMPYAIYAAGIAALLVVAAWRGRRLRGEHARAP
jgi:inner membrane protein